MTMDRRGFLRLAGAGAAVAGAGVAGVAVGRASEPGAGFTDAYPFYGPHQAGVLTPAQDRLHFAAFDLTTDRRQDVVALLRRWTEAAARMTQGQSAGPFGPTSGPYDAPPDDTGEAMGLPPANLTITFGFGATLFSNGRGEDRYGLAGQRPAGLIDLPHFPGDNLDPRRSGGDLCVQACAHDPQVAVHSIRNLSRLAFGAAAVRWSQVGFGRTSSTSTAQDTPRNLFGFKDGTANIKAEDADAEQQVWVAPSDGPAWLIGGTYLVARRIRMNIETWDRTSLREQEAITGRTKAGGSPLSGGTEFSEPDFDAAGRDAQPLIPASSHVRLAHPDNNGGARMLRRGYNFVDGNDQYGRLDAGLFFLAYQRDLASGFLPVQTALSRDDALNEYIQHVGSAVFAVPPGASENSFVGESLFART